MSASIRPQAVPPLSPGWTEHIAPGGQPYFYNAQTNESTYVRPFLGLSQPVAPRKEKPATKTPIPGTEWLRVKTTAGNVFYSNKVTKESVWTVPSEIRQIVDSLETRDRESGQHHSLNGEKQDEPSTEEIQEEIQRITTKPVTTMKRKVEDVVPLTEVTISKRTKLASDEDDGEDDSNDSGEEEEWQREAAAQLAAEAEEEKKRKALEMAQVELESQKAKEHNMPERVDLSLDEAKALFKTLLREKDINPLHPWDSSLPLFVSDPRYVLLSSVSARREAFDEYCRDRARELRQAAVKREKEAASPKDEFDRLLKEQVRSTRTSWTEFRRDWKKERRFWGWGRDDKEREKRFKEYIKELREQKLEAAQKAEVEFFALLKESGLVKSDSLWKDVKRKIYRDPRYDAVGSSSLREELFGTFLKASGSTSAPDPSHSAAAADRKFLTHSLEAKESEKDRKTRERQERAVKEREAKVKSDLERLEADIGRSRVELSKEEGEQNFQSMLTDAIRDPQLTWERASEQLMNDPRFTRSPLPVDYQMHLFHSHVEQIRSKYIEALHTLFRSHTPSLSTTLNDLPVSALLSSSPATKLGLDPHSLQHHFEVWQRERNNEARSQFQEMLTENAFVEFWGRLGKLGGEGVDSGVKAEDVGEDEGEGGGGKVDMKALAKTVDVADMERVLQNDKRFIVYDHIPEQRIKWLREYLSELTPPNLSVHVK